MSRKKTKSPTAALSDWNQGRDEDLGAVSDALAAVSPRGNTAAGSDAATVMERVRRGLEVEFNPALPAAARRAGERRQDKLRASAEEFLRDRDVFSGKQAGTYNIPEPAYKRRQAQEAERAVQRQGLSAEDYWERNPDSKRTAVNSRGETVNVMDLARDYQKSQAERAEQESRIAGMREKGLQRRKEMENEQLQARLKEKGISPEAATTKTEKTYLDELAGTKGTPGGFDPNKARGLLAQATFQGWEDDKALEQRAEKLEQAEKRRLRTLRRYEDVMGGRLSPEAAKLLADSIFEAETSIAEGNKNRGGLNRPGYWRQQAEDLDKAQTAERVAEDNIVKANNATAASLQENQTNMTAMLRKIFEEFERGEFSADRLAQMNAFIAATGGVK